MDALQGRPKAETIKTVDELRKWTLDARRTIVERYAEGSTREKLGAMIWLTNQGKRVPLLWDATDFEPHRPSNPYRPHDQDYIATANGILAWCNLRESVPDDSGVAKLRSNSRPSGELPSTTDLQEFVGQIHEAFNQEARRDWLRGKVLGYLQCKYTKDENGELKGGGLPWPPKQTDSLDISACCAALAAVHDEHFRGLRLFPVPEKLDFGETAEGELTGLQNWGWTLLTEKVRKHDPSGYLTELRAMLRDVEAACCESNQKEGAEKKRRAKKSTVRGEAETKLITALSSWHEYENAFCGKLEPVGSNELADLAEVSKGSASNFFDKHFEGHQKYKILCQNKLILKKIMTLNGDVRPSILNNPLPTGRRGGESVGESFDMDEISD